MILRHAVRALALAGFALAVLATPVCALDHPRLGLYGHMDGNGNPFTTNGLLFGPLDPVVLDQVARFHQVAFDVSPITEYRRDIPAGIRARRPEVQILGYVLGHYIWPGVSTADSNIHIPTRYRRLVRDLDGYLYNKAGQWYIAANVNLAKKNAAGRLIVAEGLADLFYDAIVSTGVWDGMFFDQFCEGILWSQSPAESIDVVRAGYSTQAAFNVGWKAGTDTLANRLRRLAGPSFILVGNCGTSDKYASFNGWMRENFPFQNGGTWYTNMTRLPNGYLADDQNYRQPSHNYLFAASDNPSTPYNAHSTREARFVLGSASLGAGYGAFAPADLSLQTSYHAWWYDEYAVDLVTGRSSGNPAHTGWLGAPLGGHYQMVWAGTNPDACTNPEFETNLSGWESASFGGSTFTRDASTAGSGNASARVSIPIASPVDYQIQIKSSGRISVNAGQECALTFWAKAAAPRRITMEIGGTTGYVAAAYLDIGTTWKRYQVSFLPNASGMVGPRFYLGLQAITTWFDDVHFQVGATSLYRRDFQNGIVLVNPSGLALSVPLGRAYRKLLGTTDLLTNNGAIVTQVAVPPSDALFLIGDDFIAPAAIMDMHAVPN